MLFYFISHFCIHISFFVIFLYFFYFIFFFIFFIFIFLFFIFLIKKFFQENSDPAALMREFWEDISQVAEVSSKHSSITCINYTFSGNAAEIHRTQKQNVSYPSTFFPSFHLSTFPLFLFFFSFFL